MNNIISKDIVSRLKYEADGIILRDIIEDIDNGLKNSKSYVFALNVPRLKDLLGECIKNKGYSFTIEDNTGFYGDYSSQTRYTVTI